MSASVEISAAPSVLPATKFSGGCNISYPRCKQRLLKIGVGVPLADSRGTKWWLPAFWTGGMAWAGGQEDPRFEMARWAGPAGTGAAVRRRGCPPARPPGGPAGGTGTLTAGAQRKTTAGIRVARRVHPRRPGGLTPVGREGGKAAHGHFKATETKKLHENSKNSKKKLHRADFILRSSGSGSAGSQSAQLGSSQSDHENGGPAVMPHKNV